MNDAFDLAFLIDQGKNILRLSLEESIERALDMFLADNWVLLVPARKQHSREEWKKIGLAEFNSWK